jgi:hypothetical protein
MPAIVSQRVQIAIRVAASHVKRTKVHIPVIKSPQLELLAGQADIEAWLML